MPFFSEAKIVLNGINNRCSFFFGEKTEKMTIVTEMRSKFICTIIDQIGETGSYCLSRTKIPGCLFVC